MWCRAGDVSSAQVCLECEELLLSQHFFVFPCKHTFHVPCLQRLVHEHLSPVMRDQVDDLIERLHTAVAEQQRSGACRAVRALRVGCATRPVCFPRSRSMRVL